MTLVAGRERQTRKFVVRKGGSSSSVGVGEGSAAIELRADETALRQTEAEEHESQVPIVMPVQKVILHNK